MIIISGATNRKFNALGKFIRNAKISYPNATVIGVGKLGVFVKDDVVALEEDLSRNGVNKTDFKFIRGSSDCHWVCTSSAKDMFLGEWGIKYINGIKIFFVSGSLGGWTMLSTDFESVRRLYYKEKPNIVITSSLPQQAKPIYDGMPLKNLMYGGEISYRLLSSLFVIHQPERWFFAAEKSCMFYLRGNFNSTCFQSISDEDCVLVTKEMTKGNNVKLCQMIKKENIQ